MDLKHFTLAEFDSPDLKGSGALYMNSIFLEMLEDARDLCDFPFIITSGYRTPAQNTKVGGKPRSAHRKGLAADISAKTGPIKYAIIEAAILAHFKRIGIGSNFIHLDNDLSLPNPTIWTY
jgi:uncharacterized protein YcbK (DUF882 family)